MWFECAKGSRIVGGELVQDTPPSREELIEWFNEYESNAMLREQVWHRFVVSRRNYRTLRNWASQQFFFRNATESQLRVF